MKRALPLGIAVLALFTGVYVACAQQQSTRVIVATVATVEPGHMAEYMDIVEESILPFLAAQGVELIGAFQNGVGGASNEFILWSAYRDMAHVQSVLENSTLTSIQQQTFESIRVLEATILNPVSFSPLR